MEEILHQLIVYPIIYKVLPPSQVVGLGISEPSTVVSKFHRRASPDHQTFQVPKMEESETPIFLLYGIRLM